MESQPYRIKPALPWPGGKSKLLTHILPLIPDHQCYVEAFAGGLAVLLAKPRSPIEVLNDVNGDLVTFYRCVRFHPEPLLTDIQRAARWYFRTKVCFRGASLDTFGVSPISSGSASSSRAARMESIRILSHRLDRTVIENNDWSRILDIYDRPTTFFFLDPPYTDCDAGAYGAWQTSDVLAFRDRVARLRGRWLVTLNDSPDIRRIFHGCHIKAVSRPKGIGGKGKPYSELIITPKAAE
jgi:DNA adenine methylase